MNLSSRVARGKESATSAGDAGLIPGSETSPGKGNGNPLYILTWRIPQTEKPGRLQPIASQRVGLDLATRQQLQGTGKCHLRTQRGEENWTLEKLDSGETLIIKLVMSTTLAKTHFFFYVYKVASGY